MHVPHEEWKNIAKKVPSLVADCVCIENDRVLLVLRSHEPFKDHWCLPGGFVDFGERVKTAAEREFFEETGLSSKAGDLVGIYDDPKRDPRGHLVSLAFFMKRTGGKMKTSNETSDVKWFDVNEIPKKIVPSHILIIKDALKVLGKK